MYDPATIELPPNVSDDVAQQAREELAGYYAHCSALDAAFGRLLETLDATELGKDTIVIFTSDHGDMLGSQGAFRKQRPWAESMRVPFLVRHPQVTETRLEHVPIDAPDMMPTMLSLCGIPVPEMVQGKDVSPTIVDGSSSSIDHALLALYSPFHEWMYSNGGREYRGLHGERYTYVRTLEGPWLLYDNTEDPHQMKNLVEDPGQANRIRELDAALTARLEEVDDDFASGREIMAREAYVCQPNGDPAITASELPEPYRHQLK